MRADTARSLFDIASDADFVAEEVAVLAILEASGAKRGVGRWPLALEGRRRVDICIGHLNGNREHEPTGIIELKRLLELDVVGDIVRVFELITRCGSNTGGSLQFGVVASLIFTYHSTRYGAESYMRDTYMPMQIDRINQDSRLFPLRSQVDLLKKYGDAFCAYDGKCWFPSAIAWVISANGRHAQY
jgi:hypothetical protein